MEPIVLFCKSYRGDLGRFKRLAASVAEFNTEGIPFWLSVPEADVEVFRPLVEAGGVALVSDETILAESLSHGQSRTPGLPPNVLQQVTKAEFWRLGKCRNYVVIDSDSWFIRPFRRTDFLYEGDIPYTVMNEGRHALDYAARHGDKKFIRQFHELRERARTLFDRPGRHFDFAPTPCIWSAVVWQALAEEYARPRGMNFQDLILHFPCETQWYGEFLLHSRTIPLIPVEPLFKLWGFAAQYEESRRIGETDAVLAENYMGIVSQSNWDEALDVAPRKKKRWRWR